MTSSLIVISSLIVTSSSKNAYCSTSGQQIRCQLLMDTSTMPHSSQSINDSFISGKIIHAIYIMSIVIRQQLCKFTKVHKLYVSTSCAVHKCREVLYASLHPTLFVDAYVLHIKLYILFVILVLQQPIPELANISLALSRLHTAKYIVIRNNKMLQ